MIMRKLLGSGLMLVLLLAAHGAGRAEEPATAPGVLTPEEAHRRAAAAAVMPHARIPLREILTEDVLAKIPADALWFRQFLQDQAKSDTYVSVILTDNPGPDGRRVTAPPMTQIVGASSVTRDDGYLWNIDVLIKWGPCGRDVAGNTIATLQMVFTASHMMPGRTGVLVLPFDLRVFKDPQNVHTYRDLKVDLKRVGLAARSDVPAAGQ
jgi:hypothetical protein